MSMTVPENSYAPTPNVQPAGVQQPASTMAAQPAAQPTTGYGVNPMENSANAMQDAFNMSAQGTDMYGDYYNNYQGMNPATMGSNAMNGYNASTVNSPNTIQSGMDTYMNPYTGEVVQNTVDQMNQNLAMQQQQTGANAAASGAFGGARHGLMEGQNAAETNRAIGDVSGNLYNQGWAQAAALSGQDIQNTMAARFANQNAINNQRRYNSDLNYQGHLANMNSRNSARQFNQTMDANNAMNYYNAMQGGAGNLGNLANQSFNMGNAINQNQMASGSMSQALNQSLMDQGNSMFQSWASQPQNILQMRLAALGMNPLNSATTTSQSMPNTLGGNLLTTFGSMFKFAPIAIGGSSRRFKENIEPTGQYAKSTSGNIVPVVTFNYLNSPVKVTGVIAEDLGANDNAVLTDNSGRPTAVDYSQLEVL